jgi:hypothetical protein
LLRLLLEENLSLCLRDELGVLILLHSLWRCERRQTSKERRTNLHLHDLYLHHLHLQRVRVRGLDGLDGLDGLMGQERRCEWSDIRIHAALLLLLGEPVVRSIDGGGHGRTGHLTAGEDVLARHIDDLIVVFLWEDGRMELRSEARNVEGSTGRSGVGYSRRGRADTACAETGKKGSSWVGRCGGHWSDR